MYKLNCLITLLAFVASTALVADDAAVEKVMAEQLAACSKNTAMEWSASLNRCVTKAKALETRNETKACESLETLEAKKACHLQIATKNAGVSADPNAVGEKVSSLQSQSAVINAATTIVSALNFFAKEGAGSNCMSKSILGVTSLGGFATDIYLKIQTKKKLKGLQDKYIVDDKDNTYATQVKALEYLKEEQTVVKKIAAAEKKRQMLLMIGYGAAAATAGYEMFTSSTCADGPAKEEGDAKAKADEKPATTEAVADNPPPPPAETFPVERGTATGTELGPLDAPDAKALAATPEATPTASYKKYESLESIKDGNVVRNVLKDTNGAVTGVVHNGQVYESVVKSSSGQYLAAGKPSGAFNYSNGTFGSNPPINSSAVTSNYTFSSSGKVLSGGSGTADVGKTSFGTGKK